MHPLASPDTCSGQVIDSHTIQRKGPLERIVDETGHVMHFESYSNNGELNVSKIGWKKASIFPGYCSGHDTSLFKPVEKDKFTGKHWHCVLHAFRNVCNEMYGKQALIESFEFQRTCIDRGFDLDGQITAQLSYIKSIEGQKKSLQENESLRAKFETAIVQGDFDAFESKCYFFQGKLNIVSSSVFQCGYDFDGNKLIDMWDLTLDAEMLSHTIANTDDGGAIIFVWLKDEKDANAVVASFDNIPDKEKGDIFVQYCFVNCENNFFSEQWWENLSDEQKAQIHSYADTPYYEGGKYTANKNSLVDWVFA